MSFWTQKRVLVTGGHGFLGHHLLTKLHERGSTNVVAPKSQDHDLKIGSEIHRMLETHHPEILIHLAALCGGIEANRQRPGSFFYDNAIMGIQLIEQARLLGVKKMVVLGTVCAYPKIAPIPFCEDDLWNGFPEETNAPYGLAKKMLLVQLQAYRQQYDFHGIYLLPANLYGPNDSFDLTTSHVIPAMIRKMVEAKQRKEPKVVLWGSGKASREFLYVEDCAEGILMATEHYDQPEPVNLGTGKDILISELAQTIRKIIAYEGDIVWDTDYPDGQPQRRLNTTRARQAFGFEAKTKFEDGLRCTVDWYLAQSKT